MPNPKPRVSLPPQSARQSWSLPPQVCWKAFSRSRLRWCGRRRVISHDGAEGLLCSLHCASNLFQLWSSAR